VRLISESGEQLGIKHIREAMEIAERQDLDIVEVAANSDPPVVRIMDYGKDKYRKEQVRKAARKKQVNINVREIKLRPKIGDHDFNTKRGHVERFLRGGDKVKVTIMFRGREVQHPELGEKLLVRLAGDLDELGRIESQPNLDGRNMVMVMAPKKDAAPKGEAKSEASSSEVTSSEVTSSEVTSSEVTSSEAGSAVGVEAKDETRSEPQESAARS